MHRPRMSYVIILVIALLIATLVGSAWIVRAQSGGGYWYIVQPGDSWWSLSARTGIPVDVLQAHNPQAIHPHLWLWRGERIWIPVVREDHRAGYWYVVRKGDTWLGIALRTGVPVQVLQRLNPHAVHPHNWMWIGDRIFIPLRLPGSRPQSTPTPQTAETVTPPPHPSPTSSVSPVPTSPTVPTSTPETSPSPGGTTSPLPTPTPGEGRAGGEVTPLPPTVAGISCPADKASSIKALAQVLSAAEGDVEVIQGWLKHCKMGLGDSPRALSGDFNGDNRPDVLVVMAQTDEQTGQRNDALVIYEATPSGYTPVFQQSVEGRARLLAFEDVNNDGAVEVVWTVTQCPDTTCYTTVRVYRWDSASAQFASFTEGEITMASATVQLADVTPDAGKEIVLHGGIIHAISAGPQRAWTEIWASREGQPYQLISRTYGASDCLYHWVLDGERALREGHATKAIEIFQQVISNTKLIPCWFRPNEETELRTFGWFRLALAYAYARQPDMVSTVVHQAQSAFPNEPYIQLLERWYTAYSHTNDPAAACRRWADYIDEHPILWEILADYGYANPTFGKADVCPDLTHVYGGVACPQSIPQIVAWSQEKVQASRGEILTLYKDARECGYVGDAYGGVGGHDMDGDGTEDIVMALDAGEPITSHADIVSGPGVLLVFHHTEQGYTLTLNLPFSSTVTLLALEDLNADKMEDIAWTTFACEDRADLCAVHAYVYSWTGEKYENWVEGRPWGYNASVAFEEQGPGSGQELIVHEELPGFGADDETLAREWVWTSDAGAPYRLYSLTYKGSDCTRYTLHSAEVAFLAGPRYGWERALRRFEQVAQATNIIPCRKGGDREEEINFLRGFALFRLAQGYVYAGRVDDAQHYIDILQAELPTSPFAQMGQLWWGAYRQTHDMAKACEPVVAYVQSHPDVLSVLSDYPVPRLIPETPEGMCPVLPAP